MSFRGQSWRNSPSSAPQIHRQPSSEIVTMNMVRIAAAAFTILTASSAGAFAADSAAAPPVGAEPQNTSASYGDWILRCARTDGPQGVRVCELQQQFQINNAQGQSQPFGQLSIGRLNPKDPMHVTFIVSPNVAFPSDVKLMSDEKDTQPVVLNWSNCVPSGCRADGEFKDDQLKRWKAMTANGHLVFRPSNGKDVPINVSVRGLAQALDALVKG